MKVPAVQLNYFKLLIEQNPICQANTGFSYHSHFYSTAEEIKAFAEYHKQFLEVSVWKLIKIVIDFRRNKRASKAVEIKGTTGERGNIPTSRCCV